MQLSKNVKNREHQLVFWDLNGNEDDVVKTMQHEADITRKVRALRTTGNKVFHQSSKPSNILTYEEYHRNKNKREDKECQMISMRLNTSTF